MKKLLLLLLCVPLIGLGQCISGDCENGQGTYIYADGSEYVGVWKGGQKDGQGNYTWQNPWEQYKGGFKDDMQHGQGTYIYADGSEYVGEWKMGQKDGQGTLTSEKFIYVGGFKDDKPHRKGAYIYANGDKYVGEQKDNMRHGQGTYTMADGTVYQGLWKNGEFVGEE